MKRIKILIISAIFQFYSYGAYLKDVPITITQPDGTTIACFATGDEYYNWAHDKDGYTIIQDPKTGYYCYAILRGDELTASGYVVGKISPKSVNLTPHINISGEKIREKVNEFIRNTPQEEVLQGAGTQSRGATGTINNIVVYIRFADDTEFLINQSTYTTMFNGTNNGDESMRNYFNEVSYNQLDIVSYFYPANNGTTILSYQDSYNKNYYCPYNATNNPSGYNGSTQQREREQALLYNAIDYIKNQVPSSLNIDYNNDGNVDNVCFIIRGGPTDWNTLLWPHKGTLTALPFIYIYGKRVCYYTFQLEESISNSVLCHEMNHTLGAPDLYHSQGINEPVGYWDLMSADTDPPPHMGAYMKYKYGGWIPSIPSITTSGTYTLQSLTSSTDNCYKIPIQGSSEYIVVEYRKKTGTFEDGLPDSGLIIYRINESYTGNFNATEPGGKTDEVYIFRPGGTLSNDGFVFFANFSGASGRTTFSNSTNPYGFTSNGNYANISIKNIQENLNGTLSFDLIGFCEDNVTYSNTSNLPAITKASNNIQTSGTVTVKSTDNVTFDAGNKTILNPGFKIESGGTFKIDVNGCKGQ